MAAVSAASSGERTRLACYASPARTDGALAIANFFCYKVDMNETPEPFNGAKLGEVLWAGKEMGSVLTIST